MLHRYGLWAFTVPRPLSDRRIWLEDDESYSLPTEFQRAIGIRYAPDGDRSYPDFKGSFLQCATRNSQYSLSSLAKTFFSPSPYSLQRTSIARDHSLRLARATGFAALWSPKMRFVSLGFGAHLLATALVGDRSEP
jgi:hypothetical protein